jgi:hypothetical protein
MATYSPGVSLQVSHWKDNQVAARCEQLAFCEHDVIMRLKLRLLNASQRAQKSNEELDVATLSNSSTCTCSLIKIHCKKRATESSPSHGGLSVLSCTVAIDVQLGTWDSY